MADDAHVERLLRIYRPAEPRPEWIDSLCAGSPSRATSPSPPPRLAPVSDRRDPAHLGDLLLESAGSAPLP